MPKVSTDQYMRAYELYRGGGGPTVIFARLQEEFGEAVTRRTIDNWIREFKDMPEETALLDAPFEWHRMEEYGLPWQAGALILEALRLTRDMEHTRDIAKARGLALIVERPITVRLARWLWRVSRAVPDAPMEVVQWLAGQFAEREVRRDLFGEPFKVADLEGVLLDWGSPQHDTPKNNFMGVPMAGGHRAEHEISEMREEAESNS